MAKVYLLLGSNLGDRLSYLRAAKDAIDLHVGIVVSSSSIYESEAWGFETENKFLNQVLHISTSKMPAEILKKIKTIERQLGREDSGNGYESRTIDIDILFYNNLILESKELTIPHNKLHRRKFTLEPLNELAPKLMHPVFQKTISELLNECEDETKTVKLDISIT